MIIKIDTTGTISEFKKIFNSIQDEKNTKAILILSCDANGFTPNKIDSILKQSKLPVFGGIYPQIVAGQNKMEKGTIIAGLELTPNVAVIPDLSSPNVDYEEIIDEKIIGNSIIVREII